ncbi:abu-12 [Pristionchus pacificus]|uniref:Abu-12 n=1 Tax=Pristionchus pacificus TaxID=54126 RepID=A0A2A6BGD0_PRIPA|nr:abu-12 [Pristionchus pacificus]|eukprot:PDM64923.1 abu-12 [Pristionchus pacificus]
MPWLRCSLPILLLLSLNGVGVEAQFAELAGLATSFLGPGLGGALEGASAGAGALGQIGQLYQLAQAGIGLAGTGVDVLNKASQGNWFPAAIEQATLVSLGGALGALGGLPGLGGGGGGGTEIGSEFGKSFPAPSVEDYETEIDLKGTAATTTAPKEDEDLSRFFKSKATQVPYSGNDNDCSLHSYYFVPRRRRGQRSGMIFFGERFKPVKSLPKRKINIILPKSPDYFEGKSTDSESEIEFRTEKDRDYDSLITKEESGVSSNTVKERSTRSEKDRIIDLERLIEVLSKNKMKDDEIAEIIKQVETNAGRSEQTSHKDDLDSTVRNISPDMFEKQQRIIKATRDLREHLDQQQKEREQLPLIDYVEPSSTTEAPTTPPTYRPITTTIYATSFEDYEETTTRVSSLASPRPLIRATTSALPIPFSTVHQPYSPPSAPSPVPFASVPLSSPSSPSSSFLYPSQLYSVSGQAIPPVQQVHPHLAQLPTYPTYFSPQSQSQFALPAPAPPPPSPASLSALPTYYTYQNANAHTVTRGTVQLPVATGAALPALPPRNRARRVRQGAGAATDPRLAAAATRTTVNPPRPQQQQQQQQVSPAVQRRFKGRAEGVSGSMRRVEGNHGRRGTQVRAQAAKSHRIFASPLSTPSPSSFPRRMVPTQPLTTPSSVRRATAAAAAAASPNPKLRPSNQQQPFVVSSESRRSTRPAAPSATAAQGRTLVTPYWIDSNFVQRFPQQARSPAATGDDLVRAEIAAANRRMNSQHLQHLQQRTTSEEEYRRELQARLRQY